MEQPEPMINDAKNTMMTSAPVEKAGFHFAGDGIFHNAYIWAENLEEATKEWLATRKPINPVAPPEAALPAPLTNVEEHNEQ
jgi:hypothetical protein